MILIFVKILAFMGIVVSIGGINRIILQQKSGNKYHTNKLNIEYMEKLISRTNIDGYTIFYNGDEVERWANNIYLSWYNNLTNRYESLRDRCMDINPYTSLERYGGCTYASINQTLRDGFDRYDGYCDNLIYNIDIAFSDVPATDTNIISFRNVNYKLLSKLAAKPIEEIRQGDKIVDQAYMSTSVLMERTKGSENICENSPFAFLVIKIPKGSKCIFMDYVNGPYERELLIERNKTLLVEEILFRRENQVILLCKLLGT